MSLGLFVAVAMYLAAGAFRESIVVCYYKAVSGKRPLSASGLAGGIEFFDLVILAAIFKSGFNPLLMIAYTAGVVLGTYLATRLGK